MATNRIRRIRSASEAARVIAFTTTTRRADISRQTDLDYSSCALMGKAPILPPYDPQALMTTFDKSNMLRQCVEAYVTNIGRCGWEVVSTDPENKLPMDKEEKAVLQSFIDSPNSEESLTGIHAHIVEDYEKLGYAFLEIIRDKARRPAILRWARASTMGVCPRDEVAIPIKYDVMRGSRVSMVTELRTFRRYTQLTGGKLTYFKEFGDPRRMNYQTGDFESKDTPVSTDMEATEIIHFRQSSEDVYGTPRWISQVPSVLGSREAEEVNLRYFEDNMVPSMILSVAGGRLTGESYRDMRKILTTKGLGKDRQNQIILLEAVPERESLDDKGTVALKLDKLSDARPSDGLFKEYDESNQSKIRSSFRLPPVAVGLSQDVTFACYDEETETLTDKGWVTIDEWDDGMRVACVDPDTGSIEFHEPLTGLLVYEVENVSMFRIQTEQQDQCVTPKHNMLYSTKQTGPFVVRPVEEMAGLHRAYFRASGVYSGGEDTVDFAVPDSDYHGGVAALDADIGRMPADLMLEWVGYYIADGSLRQSGNAVSIGAKKLRKIALFDTLHEALQDAGFRVRVSEENAGTYYTVSHKGFVSWLADNAGTESANKCIPEAVWSLSFRQLGILFDALMACDGSWDLRAGRTSGAYSTVSEKLADGVQRLATLLGYRTILRQDRSGTFGTRPIYRVLLSDKDTYQVLIDKHVYREEYSGRVYCFSVPTGVFITRRNGKVAFQGNTANVSAFIAETQVYVPNRAMYDETLNKRFVNHDTGLGLKTVKLRSRSPVITNPEVLISSLTALNVMGAITPRTALVAANNILQINLPMYPEKGEADYEDWVDKPIIFSAKTGSGNEGIDPNGAGNTHDTQAGKDAETKALEKTGEVSPKSPENGKQ